MKCPIDQTELVMTDRQGIEIDYCPKCRGVWLDRGELDKIIERSASAAAPASTPTPPTDPRGSFGRDDDQGYGHKGYQKRKKSFLQELFD